MSERLCILLIVCALILGSVSSVAAVTNHNLEWGFEVEDQFNYRLTEDMTNPSYTRTLDLYLEIDSLPSIPTNVTSFTEMEMVSPHYTWYYENGTELSSSNIGYTPMWSAVPIGNLSLVQELLDDYSSHTFEWIDTLTEWGVTFSEEYDTLFKTTTIKYSKTDGVMSLYHLVQEPTTGPIITIHLIRDGFESTTSPTTTNTPFSPGGDGFDQTLVLVVGIGGGLIAISIIALVVMKRR